MTMEPVRYTEIPFPDKRYLPGTGMLHPGKYPDGSHYIPEFESSPAFDVKAWRSSQRYLYAVDLFNYRYWWEAHEVLEDVWMQVGKRTSVGKFIQGLIQIAAALLKESQSMHQGARRLAVNGLAKIRMQSGIFLGVDIDDFSRQVEVYVLGKGDTVPVIALIMNAHDQ